MFAVAQALRTEHNFPAFFREVRMIHSRQNNSAITGLFACVCGRTPLISLWVTALLIPWHGSRYRTAAEQVVNGPFSPPFTSQTLHRHSLPSSLPLCTLPQSSGHSEAPCHGCLCAYVPPHACVRACVGGVGQSSEPQFLRFPLVSITLVY